jgi:hypothetical protein
MMRRSYRVTAWCNRPQYHHFADDGSAGGGAGPAPEAAGSGAPGGAAGPAAAAGAKDSEVPGFFIRPNGEYVPNFWEHPSFRAAAPDVADNLQIRTHKGIGDTLRNFASLHKLVGFEKIPVPAEGSADEVWQTTMRRLGMPATPAEYKLPDAAAAGVDEKSMAPKEFIEGVRQDMHESELTQRQVDRLLTRWNKRIAAHARTQAEARQRALTEADTALRADWGAQYEANGALAERFLRSTLPPEQFEAAQGLLEQPAWRRYFHSLAQQLREPNPDTTTTVPADVAAAAESKLNAIRAQAPRHPVFDKDHPEHAAAVREFDRLVDVVTRAKKNREKA